MPRLRITTLFVLVGLVLAGCNWPSRVAEPTVSIADQVLTVAAILLNVAVGAGMIVANKLHLDGLDELQRKIQLEAMALALGVGLVGGLAYSTADVTDAIAFDAEISFLVILISVAYMIVIFVGRRKYQ